MVIHASQDFIRRFKCPVTKLGGSVQQGRKIDAWSGHVFRERTSPYVIFMHDASLWTLIIPAKGVTKLQVLLPLFLGRVEQVWKQHGTEFDSLNQSIIFLHRTDRPLIGSMTDAVKHCKLLSEMDREEGKVPDMVPYEADLQRTPYSIFDYKAPYQMLKSIFGA